jgi:hypothetical protein
MTEEEIKEKIAAVLNDITPENKAAFDAYINGETENWPEGTTYSAVFFPFDLVDELGGPNDALLDRLLTALVRSKGGVQALALFPFDVVYTACYDSLETFAGYELGFYFEEDAAPVVDKGLTGHVFRKQHGFFICMLMGLLGRNPQKYAYHIPAIESFLEEIIKEGRNTDWKAADAMEKYGIYRKNSRAASFIYEKGAEKLSPGLKKLKEKVMLAAIGVDPDNPLRGHFA